MDRPGAPKRLVEREVPFESGWIRGERGMTRRLDRLTEIPQACEPEAADVPPLTAPPTRGMFRALRHSFYRLFWSGNFLSNTGTWMQNLAQGWLVLELTPTAVA